MALHVIYDESGRITQAGINYTDPDKHTEMLRDMDERFVRVRAMRLISPDEWWVANDKVALRRKMPIQVSKTIVKAGENDEVIFTGIPKGAQFTAYIGGYPYQTETIPVTELEYSIPVPCLARVTFDLWPYRTFSVEIEAVP